MSDPADRPRLSVLVITLNEERLLDAVLDSVRWADEIVVVDSGSTDRTEEIARRYTDRFYVREFQGEGLQRRRSLDLSTGDWLLYVDGDEVVTPELAASIRAAIAEPRGKVAFRMRLHTRFLNRWYGRGRVGREWKVRLFRRGHGEFRDARVHSGVMVDGPVGTLDGALQHYPYRDLAHFVAKMNDYSSRAARDRRERGKEATAGGALLRGFLRFVRDYSVGGEFRHGAAGLIRASAHGYYTFLTYAKLWESGATGDANPAAPPDGGTSPSAG